jgi:ABC-type transporter Mla MlaB component
MLLTHALRGDTMVLTIGQPIAPGDVADLCARVRAALDGCDADLIVCDLSGVRTPDAVTVDLLARLALLARRQHRQLELSHVPQQLTELFELVGLTDVSELCLDAKRQSELREHALDVEEEGDPGDPVA